MKKYRYILVFHTRDLECDMHSFNNYKIDAYENQLENIIDQYIDDHKLATESMEIINIINLGEVID